MYATVPVNTQTKVKRNRRLFIATYFIGNSTKYTTNKPTKLYKWQNSCANQKSINNNNY